MDNKVDHFIEVSPLSISSNPRIFKNISPFEEALLEQLVLINENLASLKEVVKESLKKE